MTDVVGNPEEERRAEFYYQPWAQEAVCRYFYSKVIHFLLTFHFISSCLVLHPQVHISSTYWTKCQKKLTNASKGLELGMGALSYFRDVIFILC